MSTDTRPPSGSTARSGVATAAVLVTVVTLIGRITGFVREAVIAGVFGASADVDAYLVAHQIPNVLIALISTAVVTAMIPAVSARVRGGEVVAGHRLFRTVTAVVAAVLSVAAVAMAVAAPSVVRLLAPGFGTANTQLAAELARVLLIATVLVAGMNLISGMLQVHRRFLWPAVVGVPFNVAMIAAALFFGDTVGVSALAWGFVIGSLLRVVIQLPPLHRTGFRWLGPVRLRDPGMAAITGLLPVILLGHVVSNLNVIVDRMVASGLADGAISALNYAYRLVSLPHGLLVIALLQVLYPALGAMAMQRNEFARLTTRGMTALMTLLTPVVVALVVLALPVVELIYGRGAFTDDDALRTAAALAAFAPGLIALSTRDVAMRALYGLQDRWRPAAIAGVGMAVNVVGDLTLGRWFGVVGLGAATTLSFAASAVAAVVWLARAHRGVVAGELVAAMGRNALALVPTAAAVSALSGLAASASAVMAMVGVAAAAGCGVLVHLAALRLLRAPELSALRAVAHELAGRIPRRRGRDAE